MSNLRCRLCFVLCVVITSWAAAQVDVLTQHNNIARTGANLNEHVLTPSKVSGDRFGKLCFRQTDGNAYAQPLYASQVNIPGKGLKNILLVATEHDSIYAFDADDTDPASTKAVLWGPISLGHSIPTEILSTDLGRGPGGCGDISTEVGITSTPVISPDKKFVYVVAKSFDESAGHRYAHTLHVLNLADGTPATAPVEISGQVPGQGKGSVDGVMRFDPKLNLNRPGLLLNNGVLYIAFASHCDSVLSHGWLFAYDVANVDRVHKIDQFCTTPNENGDEAGQGGIWQSGQGPACDADGNVYVSTGNGSNNGTTDFGDSVLKLKLVDGKLKVQDWFTPSNEKELNDHDLDLGSSGPVLLPDSHLLLAAGKEGRGYLIDRNAMGHGKGAPADSMQITHEPVKSFFREGMYWNIHSAFVMWKRPTPSQRLFIYVCGEEDKVKQYQLDRDGEAGWKLASKSPLSASAESAPFDQPPTERHFPWMPGGFLTLSADGEKDDTGILWVSMPWRGNASPRVVEGILRAYDARDLSKELWDSERNPADSAGMFAKFNPPTVANGRVYLATFQEELPVTRDTGGIHKINPNGRKCGVVIYGIKN